MTDSDDVITFTGTPEINISVPDKKQIALDKLRFSVQELISEFSEPYDGDQYLTTTEIIDTIRSAFKTELDWRTKQLDLVTKVCVQLNSKPFTFE
jgi:hypothetical protein